EGLLPISYAQTPRAIAEERRLFYVALTRAGRQLQMSWSLARFDSKHKPRRASRFLSELGQVEESMGRAPRVEDAVALNRCRQCGRCRPRSARPTPPLEGPCGDGAVASSLPCPHRHLAVRHRRDPPT